MYLTNFKITSGYGPRDGGFHHGVDFGTPIGVKIPALVAGRVSFEGWINYSVGKASFRELIVIVQSQGYFVVYGHLSQSLVSTGQDVKPGDVVALSGESGYVFGAHLHIEQRQGIKATSQPLSAYPAIDITPLLNAYGQEGQKMFVYARPITPLEGKLKKPIKLFNIETGAEMHDSGHEMRLVAKTNIVHGSTFLIPADRWERGEPFGFREQDVYAKGNEVKEVAAPEKPQDPAVAEKAKKYDQVIASLKTIRDLL